MGHQNQALFALQNDLDILLSRFSKPIDVTWRITAKAENSISKQRLESQSGVTYDFQSSEFISDSCQNEQSAVRRANIRSQLPLHHQSETIHVNT
ncbi:hypothetical protein CHS0354_032210 [Potamilus streckersoni]|uniref:Uncharacterized protein n=1 Tax=Potamilus streckersoni TaxID=2493646 RepID=A0AAE0WCC7_9BIVA|nr:hypothetical protein CHS0354_032210 [Potamilus streckersoni]